MSISSFPLVSPSRSLILRRAAAYLADILLLFAVLFPLGWAGVLAFGFSPLSGTQIWQATLVNFSLPAWIYFILSDWLWGGKTLGKRLFHLKAIVPPNFPITLPRALLRTAIKLLPWELAHIGGFALVDAPALQWICIGLSNLLVVVYLAAAVITHGRRSIHDWAAHTEVIGDAQQ